MDKTIQDLTDKIYKEGVERGNTEAQRIIDEAKVREQQIIEEAHKEAEKMLADAQKKSADLRKNTQAELKLFTGQALEALKTEIANLLTAKLSAQAVATATSDREFMQKVILTIVQDWAKNEELVIRTPDAEALKKYFEKNARELLDKGVKIEQVNGIKTAFEIVPTDGSYKISFGDEEFVNYFKEFLRPQLIEMLF